MGSARHLRPQALAFVVCIIPAPMTSSTTSLAVNAGDADRQTLAETGSCNSVV